MNEAGVFKYAGFFCGSWPWFLVRAAGLVISLGGWFGH